MAGAEAVDAAVLQEAADDALDADVLGQAGDARPQAADAAHDEVDLHAGLARLVERIDDLRVDERVHLHPDGGLAAGLGVADLVADVGEDARADAVRARRHHLDLGRLGIAGDEVEDARDVAADHGIGGEERQVGVDLGRHRVVVAGADVAVGGELAAFAAHDQAELGVRLELDEAVDHVHAGAFQVARPADVGRLVEARLELDHGGHRLAELGRLLERAHDRAVVGGAVERPLDRHDVGVGHRLAQELHDHVEGLVGVMDDDVLLADGGEAVAVELADALGEADVEAA